MGTVKMRLEYFMNLVDPGGQVSKHTRKLVRMLAAEGVTVTLPSRARACLLANRDRGVSVAGERDILMAEKLMQPLVFPNDRLETLLRDLHLVEELEFACNEGLRFQVVDIAPDGGFVSAPVADTNAGASR